MSSTYTIDFAQCSCCQRCAHLNDLVWNENVDWYVCKWCMPGIVITAHKETH